MIFHQHVSPWNSEIVEYGISIILVAEGIFWTNVTCFDSLEHFESLWVPDRDKERMDAVSALVDDKLGVYCSVGAIETKIAYPPLSSSDFWSIDNEGFIWRIVCGCCKQVLNVRAMSKFRLAITAKDFTSNGGLKEELLLLLIAQILKCRNKHDTMQREWDGMCEDIGLNFFIGSIQWKEIVKP